MTTPQVQQGDAAAPNETPPPRGVVTLMTQLDDWNASLRRAFGPCEFGGLSEDTDGEGKRQRISVVEDVDSVRLHAQQPDDGRALVALWIRRKSWTLEGAWRAPWPWEPAAPKRLTATELAAYVTDPVPRDPREVAREAEQLALDLAELAEHRARWEANQDVWVPIPQRWATVEPGAVILDRACQPWSVVSTSPAPDGPIVRVRRGAEEFANRPVGPTALVLVPVPVRDALTLSRARLGSQIIERKTA